MREFNLDLLISKNVAVNCKTKEEEIEFLTYLQKIGIKWCNGCAIFESNEYRFEKYKQDTCFSLEDSKRLSYSRLYFYERHGYKIISSEDLIIKPKNNFKDYGFEADFEGEILKEYENQFVGMVYQNEANFGCSWDKKGRCLQPNGFGYINMNLKPIKKEWYENPDNFPCLVFSSKINEFMVLDRPLVPLKLNDKVRPATKEEVLTLLVKE